MTSHPKRGTKLLITRIMISKFISQPQLSAEMGVFMSLACHMFSKFWSVIVTILSHFYRDKGVTVTILSRFFLTKMSLSLPCHIFSNQGVSLSDVTSVTWLSLVCHDQFVTVRASLVISRLKIYFSIRLFATVTTEQGALIIGGYHGSSVATVACYNSGWSRLDDLQSVRHNHRAIINGDKVYVIGGSGLQ